VVMEMDWAEMERRIAASMQTPAPDRFTTQSISGGWCRVCGSKLLAPGKNENICAGCWPTYREQQERLRQLAIAADESVRPGRKKMAEEDQRQNLIREMKREKMAEEDHRQMQNLIREMELRKEQEYLARSARQRQLMEPFKLASAVLAALDDLEDMDDD
jgi:hypothetical protein